MLQCDNSFVHRYCGVCVVEFGPKLSPTTSTAFNWTWSPIGHRMSHVPQTKYPTTTNPFHIYVPTNPLCSTSNKARTIIRLSGGLCHFFRYKDRSPSYRLCALFEPSSNYCGLDWKSVDTDADVARPRSYA